MRFDDSEVCSTLAEPVHRVVGATGFQGRLASEVFLMVVADVGAGDVLMLHDRRGPIADWQPPGSQAIDPAAVQLPMLLSTELPTTAAPVKSPGKRKEAASSSSRGDGRK